MLTLGQVVTSSYDLQNITHAALKDNLSAGVRVDKGVKTLLKLAENVQGKYRYTGGIIIPHVVPL